MFFVMYFHKKQIPQKEFMLLNMYFVLFVVIEHESRNFIWNNKIICIFAAKI